MKKKETKSKKKKNQVAINGKRIKFVSPNCSLYKNDSTIILFGAQRIKPENKSKNKFEEFLSRAPISFGGDDE